MVMTCRLGHQRLQAPHLHSSEQLQNNFFPPHRNMLRHGQDNICYSHAILYGECLLTVKSICMRGPVGPRLGPKGLPIGRRAHLVDCICLVVSGSSNILTMGSVSDCSCFSWATTVVLFSLKAAGGGDDTGQDQSWARKATHPKNCPPLKRSRASAHISPDD